MKTCRYCRAPVRLVPLASGGVLVCRPEPAAWSAAAGDAHSAFAVLRRRSAPGAYRVVPVADVRPPLADGAPVLVRHRCSPAAIDAFADVPPFIRQKPDTGAAKMPRR